MPPIVDVIVTITVAGIATLIIVGMSVANNYTTSQKLHEIYVLVNSKMLGELRTSQADMAIVLRLLHKALQRIADLTSKEDDIAAANLAEQHFRDYEQRMRAENVNG